MKEKIKIALEALGFELEELDDFGCRFHYEGSNYLWMYSDNDDNFLNIALPGVLDLEDVEEILFYKLMDYLNSTLKYVKVNKLHDSMWLFYERELMDEADLEGIIRRMVSHLSYALETLHKGHEELSADESDDTADSLLEDLLEIEDADIVNDNEPNNNN